MQDNIEENERIFIKKLELFDFRGITHLKLDFKPGVNLLVGVNGMGKSSVLDALAIMLSSFVRRIEGKENKSRKFIENDVAKDNSALMVSIDLSYNNENINWSIARKSNKESYNPVADNLYHSDFKQLKELVGQINSKISNQVLNKERDRSLPIAVYYDVHRAVIEPPMRVNNSNNKWIIDVYDQALEQKSGADFNGFFKWFRKQEDIENEKIRDDSSFRSLQLNTVRQAIESFIPGFKNLRIRRSPLRMTVEKNGSEFDIKQLSDGEKCLLAMVGDIARRLAMANPQSNNALKGEGIVLIDEIDLHLHPSWQRMVINQLISTFPNCQFILSTHSPQVISHVKSESVWLLHATETGIEAIQPNYAFGLDSNLILESLMDVPEREDGIKHKLEELFLCISKGNFEQANKYMVEIKELAGDIPELSRARSLIKRKELLER